MSDGLELYKKYRPTEFSQVLGQNGAVKSLNEMGRKKQIPHTILFTGASGCGKTTLARILRVKLKCSDHDFQEINASENRGIESIRDIKRQLSLTPMDGPCKVYLMDEVHQWTGEAQDAVLKMLEDTPRHVYFFLCTTDPQKLKKTIITRCTEIRVSPLNQTVLRDLIRSVCKQEKIKLIQEVEDEIVNCSEGSARKALVLLHTVSPLTDEASQLEAINATSNKDIGINFARMLINPKTSFIDVLPCLREMRDKQVDAEGIRRLVLKYMSSVILGEKPPAKSTQDRAFLVIGIFQDHFYDSALAGLLSATREIFDGK